MSKNRHRFRKSGNELRKRGSSWRMWADGEGAWWRKGMLTGNKGKGMKAMQKSNPCEAVSESQ